jgi:hypothetical protein
MSSERKQTEPTQDIAAQCCPDTRMIQNQELDGVSGGFVIYGSPEALGGPDTIVWAGTDMLRSKSLDRN